MHNLSVVQALSVWSELERAYYGDNNWGGDTAELYIYRFMPFEPTVARAKPDVTEQSGFIGDMAREAFDRANESLHNLLLHFSKVREADIEINGKELGEWLKTARFQHRVHVKVTARRAPPNRFRKPLREGLVNLLKHIERGDINIEAAGAEGTADGFLAGIKGL